MGVKGWHERYYMEKFSAKTKEDIEITRKAVVLFNQLNFFDVLQSTDFRLTSFCINSFWSIMSRFKDIQKDYAGRASTIFQESHHGIGITFFTTIVAFCFSFFSL